MLSAVFAQAIQFNTQTCALLFPTYGGAVVQEKVNVYLIVHEYCKFIAPTNATDAVAYYNVLERDNEAVVDELVINVCQFLLHAHSVPAFF